MIPPWIARAFARCESCCLDSQEDRERLAVALMEELGRTPSEWQSRFENVIDASKEGSWMARAVDAERNTAEAIAAWLEAPCPCGYADCESKYGELAKSVRDGEWRPR
jgi:hypothetical protein